MGGAQVDPALDGPARLEPGPGDAGCEPQRGIVLVQLAGVEQENRGGPRRELSLVRIQVRGGQPPALRPAAATDDYIGGKDRPDQHMRSATTSNDLPESHAPWMSPASAAESALDGPLRVDHGHRCAVRGVGVDVAVDLDPIGDVGGRGGDRRVAPV